jgi:ribonuclease HI
MQPRQDPTPTPGFYILKTDGGITAEQGQAAGPAAIGVVLKDHKYRDVDEVSKRIGWARNHHEAEYKALIAGLELARRHGIDRIRVFSDSALVVNTVNGDWNLQPEHLKDLRVQACLLVKEFADIPVVLGSAGNEPRGRHTCKQSARPRPLTATMPPP